MRLKCCRKCKHFDVHWKPACAAPSHDCINPNLRKLSRIVIGGDEVRHPADETRGDYYLCAPEGNWFEPAADLLTIDGSYVPADV